MTPLAVLLVALVAEDGTALRASPSDSAPAQAMLYRGDWLEVRGEVPGFVKVWDHRRERSGYVRPGKLRVHRAEDTSADELLAVVRFLREAPGFESLGIGYAALYLKVAAPSRRTRPEWAEALGALGVFASRLADRASGNGTRARDATLAGQLAVSESYGVRLRRFETAGKDPRLTVCYDGDAFARVLTLTTAAPGERARAALALTRRACFDPVTTVQHRRAWNDARLVVLGEVDPASTARASRVLAHRLRLRHAEALCERAHAEAASDLGAATKAAAEALRQLALVDRGELAPEDGPAYDDVAVRVAGLRFLTEPPPPSPRARSVSVAFASGRPGETCVRVARGNTLLVERCTFGLVFTSSLRIAAHDNAVALSVAPVTAWTELWIFRAQPGGSDWRVDVLPPALGQPGEDIGYVELAGFSPDGARALIAREFRTATRSGRRFELLAADGTVLRWSPDADRLGAFQRWAQPGWRRSTLALR